MIGLNSDISGVLGRKICQSVSQSNSYINSRILLKIIIEGQFFPCTNAATPSSQCHAAPILDDPYLYLTIWFARMVHKPSYVAEN
jgi:hypothetical protein